jgi:hypothetical protein
MMIWSAAIIWKAVAARRRTTAVSNWRLRVSGVGRTQADRSDQGYRPVADAALRAAARMGSTPKHP